MESRLTSLSLRFQEKGFTPIEMPWLIKDISALLDTSKHFSITEVNHELEFLGWGFDIMDNATYEIIHNALTQ